MPQEIKQIILIRRDLKMRQGKSVAQGAHAASEFMREQLLAALQGKPIDLSAVEIQWIKGGMAKITLKANSFEDFEAIRTEAIAAGLKVRVITDSGQTEFHGVPTITALAIGPDYASKIDTVTGDLDPL